MSAPVRKPALSKTAQMKPDMPSAPRRPRPSPETPWVLQGPGLGRLGPTPVMGAPSRGLVSTGDSN